MKTTIDNGKMYRLMNHDSWHNKPRFDSYTIQEHNEQFDTNYLSIDDAVNADPEYLFTEEQMNEVINDTTH